MQIVFVSAPDVHDYGSFPLTLSGVASVCMYACMVYGSFLRAIRHHGGQRDIKIIYPYGSSRS